MCGKEKLVFLNIVGKNTKISSDRLINWREKRHNDWNIVQTTIRNNVWKRGEKPKKKRNNGKSKRNPRCNKIGRKHNKNQIAEREDEG